MENTTALSSQGLQGAGLFQQEPVQLGFSHLYPDSFESRDLTSFFPGLLSWPRSHPGFQAERMGSWDNGSPEGQEVAKLVFTQS